MYRFLISLILRGVKTYQGILKSAKRGADRIKKGMDDYIIKHNLQDKIDGFEIEKQEENKEG